MITLDFETRSKADLKKVGTYEYARHPSTDVICLAWKVRGDRRVRLWHPGFQDTTPVKKRSKSYWSTVSRDLARPADPLELWNRIDCGELVEAHYAFFERCVWRWVMVERYGWPDVPEESWRCSAAKAASFALPRKLESACVALGISEKDMAGHRVMQKLTKPRRPTKSDPDSEWHQRRRDLLRVFRYCVQDVRAEEALSEQLRPMPEGELRAWQLDQRINLRGVHCDRPLVRKALRLLDEEREAGDSEIRDATGGRVAGSTRREDLLAWANAEGIGMADTQAATIDRVLEGELPDHARAALETWRSLNRSSTKKYAAMLARMSDEDDRIRDLLLYWGAATGRWAGRGIQPQNFPRGKVKDMEEACADVLRLDRATLQLLYGDVMELLSHVLRGALRAAPGNHLVVADYSAIEARGTFWISGHTEGLRLFRRIDAGEMPGQDIYTWQASEILRRRITKADGYERQVFGKVPVLGCGYQMGAPKLVSYAASMGVEIDMHTAQVIVDGYRETNWPVRRFWYAVEAAALEAVRRGRGGRPVRCGATAWAVRGRFLHCKLPSGRLLSYYLPRIEMNTTPWGEKRPQVTYMGIDTYTRQWKRVATYGGKLTENVVQALCRDLMLDAMFKAEDAGMPVVLTVHDEVVTEVPEDSPPDELARLEGIMEDAPAWAKGLPVKAEGWRGERYRKE